jgi:hypothetical protein
MSAQKLKTKIGEIKNKITKLSKPPHINQISPSHDGLDFAIDIR